ncbi:MAG: Omp28-related outer membrane protein [Bacteroidia bacterium]|nr:Omp28-related outer membrane protein [Bacteroidia bacterium]MDW8333131.1 Omp28-related outer membrane protein [Bacteroidia bacterium]
MRGKIPLIALSLTMAATACDIVGPPYKEAVRDDDAASGDTVSRVVIEKFTGFMCGNCPEAGRTAHQIAQRYQGKVFVAEIHTGTLADTFPPFGQYYFKTPSGDSLNRYYGVDNRGVPIGLVSRRSWNGEPLSTPSTWAGRTDSLLKEPPLCLMSVKSEYNAASREVSARVQVEFLRSVVEPLNLVVYLLEDSVISYQKDYSRSPSSVYDYYQRDMLRLCPTGVWGRPWISSAVPGERRETVVAFRLNETWNARHCKVLAFLARTNTREVLQAAETYVISR